MAKPKPIAGLDITEDYAFHRRFWTAQKAGWVAMALLLGAALAGMLGRGPAAKGEAEGGDVRIEYERIVHWRSSTTLLVRMTREDAPAGEARVTLDGGYLRAMGLDRVLPAPVRVEAARDAVTFVFDARGGAWQALFTFKPDRIGVAETDVAVAGRRVARIGHAVLP